MTWGAVAIAGALVAAVGLAIAGLATFMRAEKVAAWAREKLAEASRELAGAQALDREANEQLAHAMGMRAEARRIEELLVRPRFALNLQSGRIRALLHDEEPELHVEVECQAPDPNCKEEGCGGRGWGGRDRNTQRVVPCKCVKRELHRQRLAAKG